MVQDDVQQQNVHAIAERLLYQVFSRSLAAISIIRKDLLWHFPTPSFLPQNFLCLFFFVHVLAGLACCLLFFGFVFLSIKLPSLHFVSFGVFLVISMQHKMLCFYL